jgi:hypothetical protein
MIWLVQAFLHALLLLYLHDKLWLRLALLPIGGEFPRVLMRRGGSGSGHFPTPTTAIVNENGSICNISVFGDVAINPVGCDVG